MEMSPLLKNSLCVALLMASSATAYSHIQLDVADPWRAGPRMEMRGILIVGGGEQRIVKHHLNRANWWRVHRGETHGQAAGLIYMPASSIGSLSPTEHVFRAHSYRNR